MIHLTLHDEDVITKNDLLSVVAYDVGNVNPGETKTKSFCLDPTVSRKHISNTCVYVTFFPVPK